MAPVTGGETVATTVTTAYKARAALAITIFCVALQPLTGRRSPCSAAPASATPTTTAAPDRPPASEPASRPATPPTAAGNRRAAPARTPSAGTPPATTPANDPALPAALQAQPPTRATPNLTACPATPTPAPALPRHTPADPGRAPSAACTAADSSDNTNSVADARVLATPADLHVACAGTARCATPRRTHTAANTLARHSPRQSVPATEKTSGPATGCGTLFRPLLIGTR